MKLETGKLYRVRELTTSWYEIFSWQDDAADPKSTRLNSFPEKGAVLFYLEKRRPRDWLQGYDMFLWKDKVVLSTDVQEKPEFYLERVGK